MTPQEIFDRVTEHLLAQGRACKSQEDSSCFYRMGPLRCAVGCLIPDERYSPELEGFELDGVGRVAEALVDVIPTHGAQRRTALGVLRALQNCHHQVHPKNWPKRLERVAEVYVLAMPEVLVKALAVSAAEASYGEEGTD